MTRFDPRQVGWRLGKAHEPRGGDLWVPWDRTAGVIGPQGSGKTLDLLIPALLAAPGAALVTLTKADDLLLSIGHRSTNDRPCLVLDPFGLAPGLPELIWDPIAGCVDPMVAEKRAKALTAGTDDVGNVGGGASRAGHAAAADLLLEEKGEGLLDGGDGVASGSIVPAQRPVQQSVPERCGVRVFAQDLGGFDGGDGVGDPAQHVVQGAPGQRCGVEVALDDFGGFGGVEAGGVVPLAAGAGP